MRRPCRQRRGELTSQKKRKVKGKKGIGKFAGLMIANEMQVETWTRGKKCTFSLSTADLEKAHDIEDLSVNLIVESIPDLDSHGTRITLSNIARAFVNAVLSESLTARFVLSPAVSA